MRVFTTILLLLTFVFPAFGQGLSPCNGATSITYQGYDYDIVEIGDQCWFAENLRAAMYNDNSPIQSGLSEEEWWQYGLEGAGAQLSNESLGWLYNFYAVTSPAGLCPTNWHVPEDSEFIELEIALGMDSLDADETGWRGTNQGIELKSSPEDIPSWDGDNSSQFSALPAGSIFFNGSYNTGDDLYPNAVFWTTTIAFGSDAYYRGLSDGIDGVWRHWTYNAFGANAGMSVRCVIDSIIAGCTISQACNYDFFANVDDGSCLFVGESCDDGDDTTSNEIVNEDCSCEGEVIEGCTYAVACNYDPLATVFDYSCLFPGDSCDDGNPATANDTLNADCVCIGEAGVAGCTDDVACNFNLEANFDDGSCAFAGDGCDDGDEFTENDVYSDDCECAGTEVEIVPGCVYETACNFNPEANQDDMSCSFPGDSCDDDDVGTGNDTYTDDCECVGEPLAGGCTYESACNFNPDAQFDDNSCVFVGDSCDDGDSETEDDAINADCDCAGNPVTSVNQLDVESLSVYPNPVSDQLTVELGSLQGTSVLVKIFDSQGKLVFDENRTGTFIIDVSTYNTGVYSISVESESEVIKAQFIVE